MRRELIPFFLAALLCASGSAEGQQVKKSIRIGFLSPGSQQQFAQDYHAFVLGLRELGYIENKNIVIESRWAQGRNERLPALATEMANEKVDIIVSTGGALAALAAAKATKTIPIVFTAGGDLEKIGLVSSLARPGRQLNRCEPIDC
jgi:putative ABC transport system substrate-binding protein